MPDSRLTCWAIGVGALVALSAALRGGERHAWSEARLDHIEEYLERVDLAWPSITDPTRLEELAAMARDADREPWRRLDPSGQKRESTDG